MLIDVFRLSQNSFPLRLIKPTERLPFDLPSNVTLKVAGATLQDLQRTKSLFFVDRELTLYFSSLSLLSSY